MACAASFVGVLGKRLSVLVKRPRRWRGLANAAELGDATQ
jgi:hypothetical protein